MMSFCAIAWLPKVVKCWSKMASNREVTGKFTEANMKIVAKEQVEHKIHIFLQQCNILYIDTVVS